MTYNDWIDQLKDNLLNVSEAERRQVLDYYAEAYADRRAAGYSEREIIAGFGAPYDAAQAILEGQSFEVYPEDKKNAPRFERAPQAPPPPQPAPIPQPASAPPKTTAPSAQTPPAPPVKPQKKHTVLKVILIILLVVVAANVVLFLVALIGRAVFKAEYTEAQYIQQSAEIDGVSLDFAAGEFRTEFYDGDKIEIDYFESNIYNVFIKESGGTLSFRIKPKWHLFWTNYDLYKPAVIKLPKGNIYNLEVDMAAGTVDIEGGNYGNVVIDMSAGTVNLNGDSECKDIRIDLSAGTVNLNGDIVCNKMDIDLSAGKVFARAVECTSLTVDLSAGKVSVDELACPVIDINLSAGTVDIGLNGVKAEYTVLVDKSAGSCNINNQMGTDPAKKIDIDLSAGTVNINFIN